MPSSSSRPRRARVSPHNDDNDDDDDDNDDDDEYEESAPSSASGDSGKMVGVKYATRSQRPSVDTPMATILPNATPANAAPETVKWTAADLWRFLSETDGVIHPMSRGSVTDAPWKWLFLILGTDPPALSSNNNNNNNNQPDVRLSIDGQVLCHLANLYAIGGEPYLAECSTGIMRDGKCDTWLGGFEWSMTTATSTSSSSTTMMTAATHNPRPRRLRLRYIPRPFRTNTRHPIRPFSAVKFDPARRHLDVYADTLAMGVSDPSYEWPPFPAPLGRWINVTAKNLARLSAHRPEHGPVLLTPTWLAMIKFARWLICFDGSMNRSFLYDVVRAIDSWDSGPMRAAARHQGTMRDSPVGRFIIESFMHTLNPNMQYELVDEDDNGSRELSSLAAAPPAGVRTVAREILMSVLIQYSGKHSNSWKSTLHQCRDAVCAILVGGFRIAVDPGAVLVLPFDMESGPWELDDISVSTVVG